MVGNSLSIDSVSIFMSISIEYELEGMKAVSDAVASTLRSMRSYARPGMSTLELDEYGAGILQEWGARSAPKETYGFPGWTCISVNHEIAHGIPSDSRILKEGDLINIDVSAEMNGFWSDNGGSFVLGKDLNGHQALVDASRRILRIALNNITNGKRISQTGRIIEREARQYGYRVIRDLAGHGIGRGLHESPEEILNWEDKTNHQRFRKNDVVAIETFISTRSWLSRTASDGWTLTGNAGGFTVQHEHTIVVTDKYPLILTVKNGF